MHVPTTPTTQTHRCTLESDAKYESLKHTLIHIHINKYIYSIYVDMYVLMADDLSKFLKWNSNFHATCSLSAANTHTCAYLTILKYVSIVCMCVCVC